MSEARKAKGVSKPKPLHSWKEIALYLNRGVRTVQRWHAALKLPVRKIGSSRTSPVIAFPSELDEWMRHRPLDKTTRSVHLAAPVATTRSRQGSRQLPFDVVASHAAYLANQTKEVRTTFLVNELKIGLTFATLAAKTRKPETRRRNESNAKRAYEEVLRLSNGMESSEREPLLAEIERLRVALERLAEESGKYQ